MQQGYTLEPGINSATCVFPNGSSCPELEFFNGSCGPATRQEKIDPSKGSVEIQCAEFDENQHLTADIEVVVGDEFQVTLCSNPSTGFQWSEQAEIGNQEIVGQISHGFTSPPEGDQPPPPGIAGNEMWTFRALKEGNCTISFEYSQDWDGGEKATWTFVMNVLVK
ncbi:MAG: protease inhibitor I42 family protein [Anaerolineales bacterium]|nr:protease inhibitor I42 family protein [Anaerolineales bacterium]